MVEGVSKFDSIGNQEIDILWKNWKFDFNLIDSSFLHLTQLQFEKLTYKQNNILWLLLTHKTYWFWQNQIKIYAFHNISTVTAQKLNLENRTLLEKRKTLDVLFWNGPFLNDPSEIQNMLYVT